jgi:predicted regulator of Ras-like GTPase activity (Roadblock/LC7/MglB family)
MRDTLQKIVDNTPGASAAILMGFDGIAVETFVAEDADDDIESIAMEFSFRFVELKTAAESLEMGDISDITVKAEYGTMLVRCLTDEYFVAVLLRDARHFGKGRWMLRSTASDLSSEL